MQLLIRFLHCTFYDCVSHSLFPKAGDINSLDLLIIFAESLGQHSFQKLLAVMSKWLSYLLYKPSGRMMLEDDVMCLLGMCLCVPETARMFRRIL